MSRSGQEQMHIHDAHTMYVQVLEEQGTQIDYLASLFVDHTSILEPRVLLVVENYEVKFLLFLWFICSSLFFVSFEEMFLY